MGGKSTGRKTGLSDGVARAPRMGPGVAHRASRSAPSGRASSPGLAPSGRGLMETVRRTGAGEEDGDGRVHHARHPEGNGLRPHQVKTSHDGRIGNGGKGFPWTASPLAFALPSRFISDAGPPSPVRSGGGGAGPSATRVPHGGSDRFPPGSQQRIRAKAWSARHPVRLPGPGWMPGLKNRTVARMGAGDHDLFSRRHRRRQEHSQHPPGRERLHRHRQKGRLREDCRHPAGGRREAGRHGGGTRCGAGRVSASSGFSMTGASTSSSPTPGSPATLPGQAGRWRRPTGWTPGSRALSRPCRPRRQRTRPSGAFATCRCRASVSWTSAPNWPPSCRRSGGPARGSSGEPAARLPESVETCIAEYDSPVGEPVAGSGEHAETFAIPASVPGIGPVTAASPVAWMGGPGSIGNRQGRGAGRGRPLLPRQRVHEGRAPRLGRTPRAEGRPLHGGIVGDDPQCRNEGALRETPGKGRAPQGRACGRHAQADRDRQRSAAGPENVGEADGRRLRRAEASRTLAEPSPDRPGRPGGRVQRVRTPARLWTGLWTDCGKPNPGVKKTAKKTKFPLDSKHGCFKVSRDPRFEIRVRDVVGLHVNPPDHAVVLSVDEKPQIQALGRTRHPKMSAGHLPPNRRVRAHLQDGHSATELNQASCRRPSSRPRTEARCPAVD